MESAQLERAQPSGSALTGLDPIQRAGDVGDPLVSQVEQVPGGEPGSGLLVDPRCQRLACASRLDHHDRDGHLQRAGQIECIAVSDRHHEGLDRLVEQAVHRFPQRLRRESGRPTSDTS